MNREEEFENTFARACAKHTLTAGEIVAAMRLGALARDQLPPAVREAVDAEVRRQRRERAGRPRAEEDARRAGLLSAIHAHMLQGQAGRAPAMARAEPGLEAGVVPPPAVRARMEIPDARPASAPAHDARVSGVSLHGFEVTV